MSIQSATFTSAFNALNQLINRWMNSRSQLLIAYYRTSRIPAEKTFSPANNRIRNQFFQQLVDYLSGGHFFAYQQIVTGLQDNGARLLAAHLCSALQTNTNQIIEAYDSSSKGVLTEKQTTSLQQLLSVIGESLEVRFILEDKLIQLTFAHNPAIPLTTERQREQ